VAENGDTGAADAAGDGRALTLQQLLLAGLGWASESVENADAIADDLAHRLGIDRDRVRTALRDTLSSWKREAERLGAQGDQVSDRALGRLGLARREALEDLELRVAQLEHRLGLLEREADELVVDPAGPTARLDA
jgi:polyhydroxyalkanoate synthesis regulator phasin